MNKYKCREFSKAIKKDEKLFCGEVAFVQKVQENDDSTSSRQEEVRKKVRAVVTEQSKMVSQSTINPGILSTFSTWKLLCNAKLNPSPLGFIPTIVCLVWPPLISTTNHLLNNDPKSRYAMWFWFYVSGIPFYRLWHLTNKKTVQHRLLELNRAEKNLIINVYNLVWIYPDLLAKSSHFKSSYLCYMIISFIAHMFTFDSMNASFVLKS